MPELFKKGDEWEGNPGGKSKTDKIDARSLKHEFYKALRKVEEEYRFSYMEQCIKASMTDNNLRIAILKKLLPDLSETEIGENIINVIRHIDDSKLKTEGVVADSKETKSDDKAF